MTQNWKINTDQLQSGCFLPDGKCRDSVSEEEKHSPQQLPILNMQIKMGVRDFPTFMTRHLTASVVWIFFENAPINFTATITGCLRQCFWINSVQELYFQMNRRAMRFMSSPATSSKQWTFVTRLFPLFHSAQKSNHDRGCFWTVNDVDVPSHPFWRLQQHTF